MQLLSEQTIDICITLSSISFTFNPIFCHFLSDYLSEIRAKLSEMKIMEFSK